MSTSKGRTAFFLALGFLALTVAACDTSDRREAAAPGAMTTPSPGATMEPSASPTMAPTAAIAPFDKEFLMNVARDNMAEIQLGNLATQKATNAAVKQFAQRVVTDHTQAGQRLGQLATALNLTLPQELTPEQRNDMSRLENTSGKDFDREFMKMMVEDHMKDTAAVDRAAMESTNADVKQFASQLAPVMREHLKLAREVAAKVGVKLPESR
jgi:putative membrane protein